MQRSESVPCTSDDQDSSVPSTSQTQCDPQAGSNLGSGSKTCESQPGTSRASQRSLQTPSRVGTLAFMRLPAAILEIIESQDACLNSGREKNLASNSPDQPRPGTSKDIS